ELLNLIRRLSREEGITVLISSHHLHQMQQICDRVGLFVRGKLLAEGDIASLAKKLFVEEFVTIELGLESDPSDSILDQLRELPEVVRIDKQEELFAIGCSRDITGDLARTVLKAGGVLTHLNKK